MRTAGRRWWVGCAVVGLLLVGCTGTEDDSEVSAQPEVDIEMVDGAITRTVSWGVPVTVSVEPVQVRDGRALLTVQYSMAADEKRDRVPLYVLLSNSGASYNNTGPRLFDSQTLQVAPVGWVDQLHAAEALEDHELEAGETVRAWSVHEAPDGDSIDVLLPFFGYFANVPVVEAGDDFDAALELTGTPGDLPEYSARSFTVRYDEGATTTRESDQVTVGLTSDVLFAPESADLSPEATAAIDGAVAQVSELADSGEITVVGHTDAVADEAYNQTLSEERADAVADRLRTGLGADYDVSAQGRGESEPVALGTTDADYAANRRVEIVFTATKEVPQSDTAASAELPATDVPTVTAGEPVELVLDIAGRDETVTVTLTGVERQNDVLVGTFDVEYTDVAGAVYGVFGDTANSAIADRQFDPVARLVGMHLATLLGDEEWIFPLDYAVDEGTEWASRKLLGDDSLTALPNAEPRVVQATVLWPNSGQESVTVDVPGRLRVLDVPVTGSG